MSHPGTSILLVTDCSPQSQLFINYIHEQLEETVTSLAPDAQAIPEGNTKNIVLLDTNHVTEEAIQLWHNLSLEDETITLAALNLKDEDNAADLLAAYHLQGVFYRNDSLLLTCKGISRLIEGDLWMSRTLMARLINFYRQQQRNAYRPVCGLTHREMEIISLLSSGASNTDIADKLFVSEHTVKSHLYNIFKKIKVHNRIQAMNWARQNIATTPVPLKKILTGS
ncbi:LuxR C-terminal-related transcriptional regulator [Onishia niordana]|uniref:LuxR C-terminal-related transcriptional regulator n=1 Tax=Onishia niordana TaxID=2508711 RepID=UPI0010A04052|nr:LuxR C-terminal-related transcriptional regulator [Halomonas niordiana]